MSAYEEIPNNFCEIESFVQTEIVNIKNIFFAAEKIFFYDTCSFQRHANLRDKGKKALTYYFKEQKVVLFITRCILMELASQQHILTQKYVEYIKWMHAANVQIVVFNEEDTYHILSECFSNNDTVNEYLMWAVRIVKSPVSTIEEVLKADKKLALGVIEGKTLKQSDLFQKFFIAVRANKISGDNLGEELIAICIYMLSCLPGVFHGKLCVLTDDKGAAAKIDSTIKRACYHNISARIILFSTPKLVQHMFQEQIEMSEDEMIQLLSCGTSGKISVMGATVYDFDLDKKMSMTAQELVNKIMEPNGIHIVF